MHDEPQISSEGEWGDVTIMEDSKGRVIYSCRYCKEKPFYNTRNIYKIKNHVLECATRYKNMVEDVDYVLCKICNLRRNKLSAHVIHIHNISIKNYKIKYGACISEKASSNYRNNFNPVALNSARDKIIEKNGKENFYKNNGIKISEALMNDKNERDRRSVLMKDLQKNNEAIKNNLARCSEIAKKTSARKDIQEKRAKVLSNWRKNNPEDFKQKCTAPMLASNKNVNKIHGSSKSEDILLILLSKYKNFTFEKNCHLEGKEFDSLKSKEKQVDIADKINNIYIEFDGAHHFKEIYGSKKKSKLEKLNDTKKRDKLLEDYINRTGHTLIRISYDQFLWRRHNSRFTESCISKLDEIFKDIKPGIYKIGKMYE